MKALSGKPKKCKVCPNRFVPSQVFQTWCSPGCAMVILKAKQGRESKVKEQAERKELRAAKERVKTKGDHAKAAQAAVNAYVRLRDADLGCVSCDKPPTWHGQWHASHFRSRGAAPHLRFNLWNIHKSCSVCNNHLSGNILGYKPELILRIGGARVQWLESCHAIARHDVDYLKRIKRVFSKKLRRLEARRNAMFG